MMDWFRSHHGAPTDPKWITIARRAGVRPGDVAAIWWALLDHASQHEDRGSLEGFDAEFLAGAFGYEEGDIARVIEALTEKRIVVDGRIANWSKRQPKREDDSRERVRASRERKRADETPGNAGVTQRNARAESVTHGNSRTEQNREEQNREDTPPTPPRGDDDSGYAFEGEVIRLKTKDLKAWREAYHGISDLLSELRAIDDWLRDKPDKRKRWFPAVSGMLRTKHQEALAAKARASPENDPLLRRWGAEAPAVTR
ncbi:hypothetical protein ACFOGJ_16125 [Marinibaculum pumilum]|uniref:DUF1376 domain-containing protein n=1 Tax=Marinibaculum pumilum TaxID=1766165 RepID=A0ABV7L2E2_9PROT